MRGESNYTVCCSFVAKDRFQAQVQMRLYSGVADGNLSCDAILEILNS